VGRVFESLEEFSMEQSKSVHAISLFQVLEHLHAPLECLRSLRELLVPGGLLVLEVPDGTGIQGVNNANSMDVADGLDHINAFDPATLTGIAQHAGFELLRRVATPQVTADAPRMIKREVKRLVQGFARKSTSQVFRRT
jgi:2-polyprenyl-3-methyl-5-hydroxy-6-metoxy-1,4-benzoquinol methylase